jgi:hypothetical protein
VTNLGTRTIGETILLRARTHLRLESLRWPEGSVQSKELDDGAEFLYDFLLSLSRPRPAEVELPSPSAKSTFNAGPTTSLGTIATGQMILLRARTHLRLESLRWPEGSVQAKELDDAAEFLYEFLLSLSPRLQTGLAASC